MASDGFVALRPIRVTWSDGNTTTTNINGTKKEVESYYLNNEFNFGDTEEHPADKMVRGVKVEFLD